MTIRLVRVIGDVANITSPVGAKGIPVARSGPALRSGPNDPITWFDRPARTAGVIRADEPWWLRQRQGRPGGMATVSLWWAALCLEACAGSRAWVALAPGHSRSSRVLGHPCDTFLQVRALRDAGTAMPQIARRVTINTAKTAGRYPFVASLYRALAGVATIA